MRLNIDLMLKVVQKGMVRGAKHVAKKSKAPEVKPPNTWTHSKKISDLKQDEYVAGSYLDSLIKGSNKKADLEAVMNYLKNPVKTQNLEKGEIGSLLRSIQKKIDDLDMEEMLRQFRKNNNISLEDWFDYFV